ncbi:hypothetical protein J6590_059418 [Homalodisca vitripennis]|nr:hypothetical protein J6590_059418 [Homalodisca vitripennis]
MRTEVARIILLKVADVTVPEDGTGLFGIWYGYTSGLRPEPGGLIAEPLVGTPACTTLTLGSAPSRAALHLPLPHRESALPSHGLDRT